MTAPNSLDPTQEALKAKWEAIKRAHMPYGEQDWPQLDAAVMELVESHGFEQYKRGVSDEIECVERSGEHLELKS